VALFTLEQCEAVLFESFKVMKFCHYFIFICQGQKKHCKSIIKVVHMTHVMHFKSFEVIW